MCCQSQCSNAIASDSERPSSPSMLLSQPSVWLFYWDRSHSCPNPCCICAGKKGSLHEWIICWLFYTCVSIMTFMYPLRSCTTAISSPPILNNIVYASVQNMHLTLYTHCTHNAPSAQSPEEVIANREKQMKKKVWKDAEKHYALVPCKSEVLFKNNKKKCLYGQMWKKWIAEGKGSGRFKEEAENKITNNTETTFLSPFSVQPV